ncbi:MAG: hypothetical protein ACE364_04800 [Chlorobiota bacterium]
MKSNIETSPYGNNLIYKKEYTKNDIFEILKKKKLNGIKIDTMWEVEDDLSFLRDFTFLEGLDISGVDKYNFGFLKYLKNLKTLSIRINAEGQIDFSNLKNLKNLTLHWKGNEVTGLEKCLNLETLCLVEFSEKNLMNISHFRNLNTLKIKTSSLKSLDGMENLLKLKNIVLGNCRSLKDISNLGALNNLTKLEIDTCSKIHDYSTLAQAENLKELRIVNCRNINSIKFIERLNKLEKISILGNCDIIDGNVKPLENVEEVYYFHREHYNIKVATPQQDEKAKKNLANFANSIRIINGK